MSAQTLQRVAVRMLYDAAFLDRVYTDVSTATVDCDLSDEERRWLCEPDRRAWKVDPLRRSRSLAALVEEFPVSVALFVREQPEASRRLDAFFSSDRFHEGMQRGESLAGMFADWFAPQFPGADGDFVRIEAALARVRRVHDSGVATTPAPGCVGLAPAVEVVTVAQDTARTFGAVLTRLREGPVAERALDPSVELPLRPAVFEPDGLLIDGRGDEPSLEILSIELGRVLSVLNQSVPMEEFLAHAARHGADAADCRAILESLREDGLVVQA